MAQPFTREDQLGVSLLTLEQLENSEKEKLERQAQGKDSNHVMWKTWTATKKRVKYMNYSIWFMYFQLFK